MSTSFKIRSYRERVTNLRRALRMTDGPNADPLTVAALKKALRAAEVRLAELTGSTEP